MIHRTMECSNCTDLSGYYLGITCKVCKRPFRNVIMKTIKKVEVSPKYMVHIPEVSEMEQGVIYVSIPYKTANHLCLCGCGQQTITPLNDNGWRFSMNHNDGKISLSPSIGNYQFECKSHYIITNSVANFV